MRADEIAAWMRGVAKVSSSEYNSLAADHYLKVADTIESYKREIKSADVFVGKPGFGDRTISYLRTLLRLGYIPGVHPVYARGRSPTRSPARSPGFSPSPKKTKSTFIAYKPASPPRRAASPTRKPAVPLGFPSSWARR